MTVAEAPAVPRHPAKWHKGALALSAKYLVELLPVEPRPLVLDPFAGVGGIHELRKTTTAITVGLEIEPEWAAAHPGTVAGDVFAMPDEWLGRFAAVISSPCYGNRMADNHNARDLCKRCAGAGELDGKTCPVCKGEKLSRRNTYKHALGRDPSPGSSAVMQWGPTYRRFHRDAMHAILDVCQPGALIAWNVKNHYRTLVKGEPEVEQLVAEWHLSTWLGLDCHLHAVERLDAGGLRYGENHGERTEAEFLMILRAPVTVPPPRLL